MRNILRDQLGLDNGFFETRPVILIGGNKTLMNNSHQWAYN
jgi:hypothetical protein